MEGSGATLIVNVATASLHSSLFRGHRTRHAITALAYHPGRPSLLLAVGADGIISLYSMDSETLLATVTEKENEINAMDFCMDGSTYATAGKDRHIRLYDSHTNQLSHILQAPDFMTGDVTPSSGHSRRIFALRFHPGERHVFLTAGWDDCVKIWDKRMAKEAQRVINGPHICGPGLDIQGNCVLTGSWVPHNALQLWDLRTSQLQKNLPFPGGPMQGQFLYAARFCDQDIVVAGGSGTSGASAIHTGTNQVLGEILLPNKPVQAVAVAPGLGQVQGTGAMWGLVGALVLSHLVSLLWNILCCVRHTAHRDESRRLLPQFSRSVKHVTEEIPVYGNISYLQTGQSSGFESSAVSESQEEQESSPKKPTCYANLKMLKPQGRQLPESSVGGAEIQYTDVVVTGPRRSEPEIWGGGPLKGREATRPQSELYASVHSERYTAKFENQDYANNHAVPS
ncbi:Signaling threshold-regulating transmembrane adapter 1 [Chelonia mydas]|uniref:Signaling threshold-regulating transmembrane adapter 1 n=1 Tax=Chelonia mydas TaxID=8469 RepID=M7AMX4_CHEMY|nr:Signaling threshold-regulating transmembrane adapter 1 [Chelonia mydas]